MRTDWIPPTKIILMTIGAFILSYGVVIGGTRLELHFTDFGNLMLA